MIDKRKPRKHCPYCCEVKDKDEFKTRVQDGKLYSFWVCKECQPKHSRAKYEERLKVKRPKVGDGNSKMCHCCFKTKPMSDFRDVIIDDKTTAKHNNCIDCEDNRCAVEVQAKSYNHSEAVNDTDKSDHYCAFIGDTPYKEICKIFKIRHE